MVGETTGRFSADGLASQLGIDLETATTDDLNRVGRALGEGEGITSARVNVA
jgi:hypothetical protein